MHTKSLQMFVPLLVASHQDVTSVREVRQLLLLAEKDERRITGTTTAFISSSPTSMNPFNVFQAAKDSQNSKSSSSIREIKWQIVLTPAVFKSEDL